MIDNEHSWLNPRITHSSNILQQIMDRMKEARQNPQGLRNASESSSVPSGPAPDTGSSAGIFNDPYQLKDYEEAIKKKLTCPYCGHCPTCGRGPQTFPSYPAYPNYPTYPGIQPWITYCGDQPR